DVAGVAAWHAGGPVRGGSADRRAARGLGGRLHDCLVAGLRGRLRGNRMGMARPDRSPLSILADGRASGGDWCWGAPRFPRRHGGLTGIQQRARLTRATPGTEGFGMSVRQRLVLLACLTAACPTTAAAGESENWARLRTMPRERRIALSKNLERFDALD